MKKSILLFLTAMLTISLSAQTEDTEVKKIHELGINATSFVKTFLSLNVNDVSSGAYMITYKQHKKNRALRLGLGGQISQLNEDIEGGGTRKFKDNFASFRIGYEWNKSISSRWNTYYGIDAIVDFNQSASTTITVEEIKISNETIGAGGGPVLGIQFFLNSRISLATEGTLYFRHTEDKVSEKFSISTQFNNDESTSSDRFTFGLPTAIFFNIRF